MDLENSSYPNRCRPATHSLASLPQEGGGICVHGRLVECGSDGGSVWDAQGRVRCAWHLALPALRLGDLVEVEGEMAAGVLQVSALRVLAPARREPVAGEWGRFGGAGAARGGNLELRARVLQAVRAFFGERGFLEVETPVLVRAPGQEAQLQLFETAFHGRQSVSCCLVSSPEHHMKRLLGGGFGRIYQITRAFRNGERSPHHNPEFAMLEWYRAYASYEEIMEDVEALVAQVCLQVRGSTRIHYRGKPLDLAPPWPRISVREAFLRYSGVDLRQCASREVFFDRARTCCASVDTADSWEEIFFKVFLELVEPALDGGAPVLLKDYPVSMAALAKIAVGGEVAERVEAYVGGLELANGFTELNDPQEQGRRFAAERQKRQEQGYPLHPLDEEFLGMMEEGMPPAGGMALGVDRLVMLLADAASIDEVIAFPFDVAEGCL